MLAAIALIVLIWVVVGIRRIDDRSFGVIDGLIVPGDGVLVEGGFALSPPWFTRLHTYPRDGVELALPQAELALLRSADGSRFGLRGWITLRARWKPVAVQKRRTTRREPMEIAVRAALTASSTSPAVSTAARSIGGSSRAW